MIIGKVNNIAINRTKSSFIDSSKFSTIKIKASVKNTIYAVQVPSYKIANRIRYIVKDLLPKEIKNNSLKPIPI